MLPPQVPLMTPQAARGIGRALRALSDSYTEGQMTRQAAVALRDSEWWLAYAITLAQTRDDAA